jgi:myo-inositol-1-phosphate synthase
MAHRATGRGSLTKRGTTGVWLIGGRGSIATAVVAGTAAIRSGLADPAGLITAQRPFTGLGLPGLSDLVFGGHDPSAVTIPKRAEQLVQAGVLPAGVAMAVQADLAAADEQIRPGVGYPGDERSQREAAATLIADLAAFQRHHELARTVVVNVASTEPPVTGQAGQQSLAALESALDAGGRPLPASSLYAYAALRAGCPYVNFTPSTGLDLPALAELAAATGLPYAGSDGKTGQTLVRSALAPALASRSLRVLSWSGTNLLGGGDGAALADPGSAASKIASKQRGLAELLGRGVEGQTHIDYVPTMGEWKTAWDHVTFEGFLGVRMSVQVTWQGCDSTLAAPLVIDLVRLTSLAYQRGRSGPLAELAFFFKDPVAATDHRIVAQYDALLAWAAALAGTGHPDDGGAGW